jgi:hypothetical protein
MVEWSRKHGATPYFILLGDNPNRTVLLRKGISEYDQNDDEAAIRDLTRFLTSSRTLFGPIARKYLSMAYERLGLKEQAQHALLAKPVYLLHGGDVVLEDSVYNKIMRDVAREYAVQLVDAKSELDKRPWVYFDMCHFDMEGHEIVGKMISELLTNDSEAKTTAKNKSGRY